MDGVHTAVIYMLLPLGFPWMEPTEEMDYLGWNLLKKQGYFGWNLPDSHLQAVVSIGLLADEAYREDGPLWIKPRLRPRTDAIDGIHGTLPWTYGHMDVWTYMDMWTFRHIWTYRHNREGQ